MAKKPKLREWPADEVTRRPTASIQPYPRNPRTHSDEQVRLLAQSIEQYGFTTPLLVDEDGVLLYGHGRLLAAQMLGLDEVPVVVAPGWTEAQKSAYRIMDNQLGLLSGWDMPMLKAELHDLSIDGSVELDSLGFPELQLGKLGFGLQPPGNPEATPELPADPITKTGDLWLLGEHRLLCGDCIKNSARLLGKDKLDLVFTDPPYNVAFSSRGDNNFDAIENDSQTDAEFATWIDSALAALARAMRRSACVYVCHTDAALAPKMAFESAFAKHFHRAATIIWVKQAASMGWQDYRAQHEPILYGWKDGDEKHFFVDDRSRTTVWNFSRDPQASYIHPTQKPVALIQEAILNSSQPGWTIGDFFAGSGTAIIAAEITKRRCLAMEIDPRYVDVAVARWEQFTGKKAQKKTPRRSEESSACA